MREPTSEEIKTAMLKVLRISIDNVSWSINTASLILASGGDMKTTAIKRLYRDMSLQQARANGAIEAVFKELVDTVENSEPKS